MVASFVPTQSISASATADTYAGGIVGVATDTSINNYNNQSDIQNNYHSGTNSNSNLAGGLAGSLNSSTDITNQNNIQNPGDIINSNNNTNTNNSGLNNFTPDSGDNTGSGENTAVTYTYDEATNTYTVCDEEGLDAWNVATQSDPTADITLTSQWNSVGNLENPYVGNIVGNGHTITSLTINQDTDYAGFIGYIGTSGSIKNLTLKDLSVTSTGKYTAGFVGYVKSGNSTNHPLIENCSVEIGIITSTNGAAGIVGYVEEDLGMSVVSQVILSLVI